VQETAFRGGLGRVYFAKWAVQEIERLYQEFSEDTQRRMEYNEEIPDRDVFLDYVYLYLAYRLFDIVDKSIDGTAEVTVDFQTKEALRFTEGEPWEIKEVVKKRVEEDIKEGKAYKESKSKTWLPPVKEIQIRKDGELIQINPLSFPPSRMNLHYRSIRSISDRIFHMTNELGNNIYDVLDKGIMEGKSVAQIQKELEGFLKEGSGVYRARTLAQTAVTHTYQLATIEAGRANPECTGFKWLAANNDRVCDFCAEMDGRVFAIDEPIPLDHPNGQCTLAYVFEGERGEGVGEIVDFSEFEKE